MVKQRTTIEMAVIIILYEYKITASAIVKSTRIFEY